MLGHDGNRLSWILAWSVALLILSCALSWVVAARWGPISGVAARFAPAIATSPAWYRVFEVEVPDGASVFVGCEMKDGGYVSGRLDWFSTEAEETPDRDIVLAPPFLLLDSNRKHLEISAQERIILSAREVGRIDVTYLPMTNASEAERT